jgi:streptomycin 6-kinase
LNRYHYQIDGRRAAILGPIPANRRRQARRLLSLGRATLAAISAAWYGGDDAEARREIYAGSAGAQIATMPVPAVRL